MHTFLSADYHFYHKNIIKYCGRPFKDEFEMADEIIRRHNERVTNNDVMYCGGDFGFFASQGRAFRGEGRPYNPDEILAKMNGKTWYFVAGNHDKNTNKLKAKTKEIILKQNNLQIQLIHDPMYAKIEYDLILCGHVHEKYKARELNYYGKTRLIINVGVDVWNFYPVRLDELLSIYYKWKTQRSKIQRWETPKVIEELNRSYGNKSL